MRLTHALVPLTALMTGHLLVACSDAVDTNDCHSYSTCPGGSSTAGTGGNMSEAGADTGGSASGKGGTSGGSNALGGAGTTGEGGSEAGAGGTPIVLPCDGACTGNKPVCKENTDTCVECLLPSDCTSGVKTKCDTASNSCVQCLAPTDCSDAKTAKCDKGTCAKCTTNDDCAHLAGKTVCDTAAGECVQCTGKDYASCGTDMGTPLVCDSLSRTCSTAKERSGDLCHSCVADAQCLADQICVKETFGQPVADVGYFCFQRANAATCSAAPKPYSSLTPNQTSIDGVKADICGLRSSTCIAVNDVASSKDCATGNAADNTKCGFAAGVDSKCVNNGGDFGCTMACVGSKDCPGSLVCDGTFFCKL